MMDKDIIATTELIIREAIPLNLMALPPIANANSPEVRKRYVTRPVRLIIYS